MNTLSYKTVSVSKEAAREQKEWVVIDATDQVVGRLASKVAKIIRGKYKPTFTPNQDCGDNVIIINADKVVFTGKKETDKVYTRYTGYPGGRIPIPGSSTSTCRITLLSLSGSDPETRRMILPRGVYFTALFKRFITTCFILTSSP